MKTISIALAMGAALVAAPAAAQAGDADNGGFFVGLVGGYDVINIETGGVDADDTGAVYGVTAGYDVDAGKALIGLEAEVTDTSISDGGADAGLDLYGGLRLGYEMDDNDVIYLKAGYTRVDVDLFDDLEGVRVGAGFEHNFGGRLFGRVEYRYSNYNISDVTGIDSNANRHQLVLAVGGKF